MRPIPRFDCVPGCSTCCTASLVPITHAERARIDAAAPGHRWTKWGDDGWVLTAQLETMRCPLLTAEGRCSVHDIRPVRCQIYGLVDQSGWRCTKGGTAERMLTTKEADRLMRRAKHVR